MSTSPLLHGKRILITGIVSDRSIAFVVARRLAEEGAEVVISAPPQTLRRTSRLAADLGSPLPVVELDVTVPQQLSAATDRIRDQIGGLDGVLHAVAFAPRSCIGGSMLDVPWEDVSTAIQVSTYSLAALAALARDLAPPSGSSIVALDFDARLAWPEYNWMGVAKAGLESLARYLARELGPSKIRVNLVAAGPVRSLAARAIPGFSLLEDHWDRVAPLGWADDPHRRDRRHVRGFVLRSPEQHDWRNRARRRGRARGGARRMRWLGP